MHPSADMLKKIDQNYGEVNLEAEKSTRTFRPAYFTDFQTTNKTLPGETSKTKPTLTTIPKTIAERGLEKVVKMKKSDMVKGFVISEKYKLSQEDSINAVKHKMFSSKSSIPPVISWNLGIKVSGNSFYLDKKLLSEIPQNYMKVKVNIYIFF